MFLLQRCVTVFARKDKDCIIACLGVSDGAVDGLCVDSNVAEGMLLLKGFEAFFCFVANDVIKIATREGLKELFIVDLLNGNQT